jgi:type IX secretion system PorP/SprF family membrane protein
MKKALTILFIFVATYTYAQQDPYYTHFKNVQQAYNPASAGVHYGDICISGLTHHQWRDYDDQTSTRGSDADPNFTGGQNIAPVTYNLNVGTAWKISKADSSKFIGTGLSVIDDQVGYTRGTAIMLNLNYKMLFQGGFNELAIGVGVGGNQWGFDKALFKALHPNDPKVPEGTQNEMKLDLNVGVHYKQRRILNNLIENFYAGLSVTNVNGAEYNVLKDKSILTRKYVPHYYALVGGDYRLNGNLVLEPAILAKYALMSSYTYKPQFDINVTALYAETLRGGIGYRQWGNADAISLLFGYVKKPLEVGYAYDITVSNIQKVSNGTHEIFVKYCIPINFEPPTPIIRLTPRFL